MNKWLVIISSIAIPILAVVGGYLVFVVPPPEARPNKGSVMVEFQRLPAATNTHSLFKMMEGAVLEKEPAHSTPDSPQYWVTNGQERYSLVTDEFRSIWEEHALNGVAPVGTPFWRAVSGDESAYRALSLLAAASSLPSNPDNDQLAWKYGCHEAYVDWEFGVFGSDTPLAGSAEMISDAWSWPACQSAQFDAFDFIFTVATITNYSSEPVSDFKITFRDTTGAMTSILGYPKPILSECTSDPFWTADRNRLRDLHTCLTQLLERVGDRVVENTKVITRQVSVLQPGAQLILLVNAYSPDEFGLPNRFAFGHLDIDEISYVENGFTFEIDKPRPLGADRLGIITSADGGIGGQ